MANIDLKGFSKIGDSTLTNDVRENIISFFDWGLLQKENFINVGIPSSGYYGGNEHQLRLVNDPRYTSGQVWEGFRQNWVWESGVTTGFDAPLVGTDNANPGVSGVYVDDTFHAVTEVGTYAHHINHPLGRVVFDSPIATTSVVTCAYSYKYINVTQSNGLPWFTEIQKRSERVENPQFHTASGDWSQLSQNRLQLPALGVEVINNRSFKGYQLGGSSYVYTDVLFHCVSEDAYIRDNLLDIVTYQNGKNFSMYDLNLIAESNAFPLDHNGVPASGALRFSELITQYPFKNLRLFDMKFDSVYTISPNLHVGTIKCSTEVILGV
jgi:hypothetical protein